ncbi:MAG TPA: multicopper oxidase domain-containing protein, partial [Thermoanaerobaculia bacterium]|nr:multicopper oxidase domain-containing protein [Thermoanaerobaculia bacterium]
MNARFRGTIACLVLLIFAGAAWGQPPCKETVKCVQIASQDLWNPQPIGPGPDGVLNTVLDVQMKSLCVPTTETSTGSGIWNTQAQCLRTYVYPGPDGKPTWGYKDLKTGNLMVFPGPTLRLAKGEAARKGNTLKLVLKNNLTPSGDECKSACANPATSCPAGTCDSANLAKLINACANTDALPSNCCCIVDCTQKAPNCFHGNETTNLHFHGSHISPQAHQDFVLLELKPESARPAAGAPAAHGAHGSSSEVAYGSYDYLIPEFGPNQPEGTHWYHPHKHGSTSIQILNGMAGALIITGEIDAYLKTLYGNITEQLLVLQQISSSVNLYTVGSAAPQTLVNGQVNPTIRIKAGEIQRWRIINATMQQSSQIKTYFPAGLEYRQMAWDGITFSPVNFKCQTLYSFNPTSTTAPTFACTPNPTTPPQPVISPGNRVDYLVRAPSTTSKAPQGQKERKLTVRRQVVGGMQDEGERKILLRDDALAPGDEEPALFSVVIEDGPAAAKVEFPDPAKWPKAGYLSNITDAEVATNPPVKIDWQQFVARSKPCDPQVENCVPQPWPYGVRAFTTFFINGKQFDSSCADVTTKLGTAAEWTVSNFTKLNHPFHIHTNPFQLVSFNGATLPPAGKTEPEPVWMDTIALPQATLNPNAAPKNLTTAIQITPVSL